MAEELSVRTTSVTNASAERREKFMAKKKKKKRY